MNLRICVIALIFQLLIFVPVVQAVTPLDEVDAYKTIMIDAKQLDSVIGEDINSLSMAAYNNDYLEPIPYQIDEYNTAGAVYFEGWDVPLAGTPGVLDSEDKLLFLYKDSGPRRKESARYDGGIVHEIRLSGQGVGDRYVYLVKNSRLRSDENYVRYSADEALVETDFYTVTYDKNNHIEWLDFSVLDYESDKNPFDVLKIRIFTSVLGGLIDLAFNNNDVKLTPKIERIGPIRTTAQMKMSFQFLGMSVLNISMQLHHSIRSLTYDVRSNIPAFRRSFASNPLVFISLEGNDLQGSQIRTANGPESPAVTDGKMDDIERAHVNNGVDIDNSWIWASTRRNLDFIAFFDFNSEQTEDIDFYYNDDAELSDPPERFLGQLPNVGYRINGIPDDGVFGFVVSVHMSNGFKGNPEIFSGKIRRLPDIVVLDSRRNNLM
ncbi:hypothetical protein A9Q99_21355 [Gammaproteobacteria bacterium 45_16_T64]|nr:hypothetical protein A9Q99_21355 [Gammaproteobacteria bacterium 45_16_T64]